MGYCTSNFSTCPWRRSLQAEGGTRRNRVILREIAGFLRSERPPTVHAPSYDGDIRRRRAMERNGRFGELPGLADTSHTLVTTALGGQFRSCGRLSLMTQPFGGAAPRWLRLWSVRQLIADCAGQSLARCKRTRAGLLVGAAVRSSQLAEPAYAHDPGARIQHDRGRRCNEVVGPPSGRGDLRFQPRPTRWSAFAATHRMRVRGHTLVWEHANPPWLTDRQTCTVQQLAQMLAGAHHARGGALSRQGVRVGCGE